MSEQLETALAEIEQAAASHMNGASAQAFAELTLAMDHLAEAVQQLERRLEKMEVR